MPDCPHWSAFVISWDWAEKPNPKICLKCPDCGDEMSGTFSPAAFLEVAEYIRRKEHEDARG